MTPLLDRLRAQTPAMPWWINPDYVEEWERHRDKMLQFLRAPELAAFNIDDVAKFYFEDNPQEDWSIDDLTGLKVPFGLCWMEHRIPDRIHSEIGDQDLTRFGGGEAGWLILEAPRGGVKGENIPENTATMVCLEHFLHYAALGETKGPHGFWLLAVDECGTAVSDPFLQTWIRPDQTPDVRLLQAGLHVPLLACSDAAKGRKP